jgi:DNA-binding NtrC family response regulator
VVERGRILVVDDDDMILESLASILESEGYIASTARTGEEAIEKTEKEFFNAILVDIHLPDMTGIEVLSRISETTLRMKKLILTGFPETHTAIDAVNRKADAYLVKPFDPELLLELIEQNLKQQEEELKYAQEKVLEYIRTRVKQLDEAENAEIKGAT